MSYTEQENEELIALYLASPCRDTINELAEKYNKSFRSIIAKLSSAGVYQTPKRTTKTGEEIVRKQELVQDIEAWLKIEAPSLVKVAKVELKRLHAVINGLVNA